MYKIMHDKLLKFSSDLKHGMGSNTRRPISHKDNIININKENCLLTVSHKEYKIEEEGTQTLCCLNRSHGNPG